METALFNQHGPAGLVRQVALSTQHGLLQNAEAYLRAMIRITTRADHRRAHRAGGALVVTQCLLSFPTSVAIARAALIAGLYRCYGERHYPFHTSAEHTTTVVKAILATMKAFNADYLTISGGLRLLKCHVLSRHELVEAPAVVEAAAAAMRTFPNSLPIQTIGAHVLVGYNAIEPCDIRSLHGEAGYNSIAVTSITMAVASPPSLRIGQESWQTVVLKCYPRLRSRGGW